MSLSTIIVTYNSQDTIGKCLGSLLTYGPEDNQIVVVDNASTDKTVQIVKNYRSLEDDFHNRILLVENAGNAGLGTATCVGYDRTTGDHILVSNPDILFNDSLNMMLKFASDNPSYDVIMPQLVSDPKGVYHNAPHYHKYPFLKGFTVGRELDIRLNGLLTRYYCKISKKDYGDINPEDEKHAYGASCMFWSRRGVEKIGGIYRPSYFWVWADADMGMRMAKYGCNGKSFPKASVYHYGGKSKPSNPLLSQFLSGRGQSQWQHDWGHATKNFLLFLIDTMIMATVTFGTGKFKDSLRQRIMFLKGWASI